jgi:hypothetical protein
MRSFGIAATLDSDEPAPLWTVTSLADSITSALPVSTLRRQKINFRFRFRLTVVLQCSSTACDLRASIWSEDQPTGKDISKRS